MVVVGAGVVVVEARAAHAEPTYRVVDGPLVEVAAKSGVAAAAAQQVNPVLSDRVQLRIRQRRRDRFRAPVCESPDEDSHGHP